mmetsp:Transcript_95702/g.270840  ORF Transcript_95702/g.270840 Transcript_95702/m.270840 type:complete len:370 (-) Transcript_95702:286-1395(-)
MVRPLLVESVPTFHKLTAQCSDGSLEKSALLSDFGVQLLPLSSVLLLHNPLPTTVRVLTFLGASTQDGLLLRQFVGHRQPPSVRFLVRCALDLASNLCCRALVCLCQAVRQQRPESEALFFQTAIALIGSFGRHAFYLPSELGRRALLRFFVVPFQHRLEIRSRLFQATLAMGMRLNPMSLQLKDQLLGVPSGLRVRGLVPRLQFRVVSLGTRMLATEHLLLRRSVSVYLLRLAPLVLQLALLKLMGQAFRHNLTFARLGLLDVQLVIPSASASPASTMQAMWYATPRQLARCRQIGSEFCGPCALLAQRGLQRRDADALLGQAALHSGEALAQLLDAQRADGPPIGNLRRSGARHAVPARFGWSCSPL